MNKDNIYFNPPDTLIRQKPDWAKDVDQHVADFIARGGTITQLDHGDSFYAKHYAAGNKHAFVINPAKPRHG